MSVTIKDLARIAGVSPSTVSRVMNGVGGYSEEVAEKILRLAAELGYRKNENASSLVRQTSRLIGVIIPDVSTSFSGEIVNGIEDAAHEKGYSVILTHAGDGGQRLGACLDLMAERRVDGLVIVSMYLDTSATQLVKALKIPTVLLSTQAETDELAYLKVDDYAASFFAVNYLIKQGHEDIGLVGVDPSDLIAGKPRIAGYQAALQAANLPVKANWLKTGDFSFAAGRAGMASYLAEETLPTAIFCVSDEAALGVISVCYENKLTVPNDISLIGYDNSPLSAMSTPALTTISQPFYEMGSRGCEALINALQTKQVIASAVIPFELVERQSVKQNKK